MIGLAPARPIRPNLDRRLRAKAIRTLTLPLVLVTLACGAGCATKAASLRSWNDGPAKAAIVEFVEEVSAEGSPTFVPAEERVAVFDNDGTLWSERPIYFQPLFAMDRVKALAPLHPDWADRQPFKGVLEGDMAAVAATGEKGLLELVSATHTGMTASEFETIVRDWLASARHPTTGRLYTEMVYQPMLELLAYLRENGFKTFIVSGGGVEFMRTFAERVYGVPPEQVVGSTFKSTFALRDGLPVIVREPTIGFVDDGAGKPIGIASHIGRVPLAAFGNSDGDLQMLQWTTIGRSPSLGVLIHHTDAIREWAYDRDSAVGRLDVALDEAAERGWIVVDMARDWKVIYPPIPAAPRAATR